ncbi:MAG: hypothetical protein WCL06_03615 [Bacteroidota bacterium]
MSNKSKSGVVKAPTARFKEPYAKPAKAVYYKYVCNKMLGDDRFEEYFDYINQALGVIADYKKAIRLAFSRTKGTAQARDLVEIKMKSKMNYLLSQIQTVANDDPEHAKALYDSFNITYKKRFPYDKKELKVKNTKVSGTLNLMIKMPEGLFAVLWMYTTTPDNEDSWKIADFSHTSKGSVSGLIKGTTYYFRARTSSSAKGKSDWTHIVEIICL